MNTNNANPALSSQLSCIRNYSGGCDSEKLGRQGLIAVKFQKIFVFPNISPYDKNPTPRQVEIKKLKYCPKSGHPTTQYFGGLHIFRIPIQARTGYIVKQNQVKERLNFLWQSAR